jgi:hypothetical protein
MAGAVLAEDIARWAGMSRWCGLASVAAGVLMVVATLLHPSRETATTIVATESRLVAAHVVYTLRVVGDSRVVAPNRWPHERARQEVEAPKRALDGMETRRDNIIPRGALAEGNINSSDRIVVELLRPPDMPQMIMIRWPQHSTMVAPTRFPSTASEIARLFARASTELTWIKARRL